MSRGYAKLGKQAGDILGTLANGANIRNQGYLDSRDAYGDYSRNISAARKNSLEGDRILAGMNITGDDIAKAMGVLAPQLDAYRNYQQSGGQNFGSRDYQIPDEFVFDEADAAMLDSSVNDITQQPEYLTPDVIENIRQADMATVMNKMGGGTSNANLIMQALQGAGDKFLEDRLMSGQEDVGKVRNVKSALKGTYPPDGSGGFDFNNPADVVKRLGTGEEAAFFMQNHLAGMPMQENLQQTLAKYQEMNPKTMFSTVMQALPVAMMMGGGAINPDQLEATMRQLQDMFARWENPQAGGATPPPPPPPGGDKDLDRLRVWK